MSRLFLFPLVLGISFPIIFLITYGIAVWNGHIPPIFSYISDTGTTPPEMGIFSQLLHLVCILYFCVIYIRYKQVEEYFQLRFKRKCMPNTVAFFFGIISVFGASMVANFQETNQLILHVIGAILVFFCASIWSIIQGYLSMKLLPDFSSKLIAYVRIGLGIAGLVLFLITECTGLAAVHKFKGDSEHVNFEHTAKKTLNWTSSDRGWDLRGVSVIFEWTLLLLFVCYILTYTSEFSKLDFQSPRVIINVNEAGNEKTQEVDQISLNEGKDSKNTMTQEEAVK